MTAEGRTGHLQVRADIEHLRLEVDLIHVQRGAGTQEVDIAVQIHVEVGAVGAQARVQTGGAAGRQITADVARAEEQDLGMELLHGVGDDLGIGVGCEVLQQGAVVDIHLVRAVAAELLGDAVDVVAEQDAAELHAQLIGQLATLGNQLKGGGHHLALTLLTKYPHAGEGLGIRVHKSRHVSFLPSQMMCLAVRMPKS